MAETPELTPDVVSLLRDATDTYYRTYRFRIAMENRNRKSAAREAKGYDLLGDLGTKKMLALIHQAEEIASIDLTTVYMAVPRHLRQWQRDTFGVGELSMAQLLGLIGDPCLARPMITVWNKGKGAVTNSEPDPEIPPYTRTVSQLWAYAGLGDPTLRSQRGKSDLAVKAMGKSRVRTVMFTVTGAVVRKRNEGEAWTAALYEQTKEWYQTARPEWSPGHQENAARRYLAKMMLKDLYRVHHAALQRYGLV